MAIKLLPVADNTQVPLWSFVYPFLCYNGLKCHDCSFTMNHPFQLGEPNPEKNQLSQHFRNMQHIEVKEPKECVQIAQLAIVRYM